MNTIHADTKVEKSTASLSSRLYCQGSRMPVIEGWHGDEHLILFSEAEIADASDRYAVPQFLPGFKVIGLRGWDDFILQDSNGATYCVPAVPAIAEHISAYALPPAGATLSRDDRFQGKIKWYLKPILFGGDPQSEENIIWAITTNTRSWSSSGVACTAPSKVDERKGDVSRPLTLPR